jgi:hypothetical protein
MPSSKWILVLCCFAFLTPGTFAQNSELTVFGEGLFLQHGTGGLGARASFEMIPGLDLEGEFAREFHSETFFSAPGQKSYNTGFTVLGGPRLRLPLAHLFATAKGGLLRTTEHPEDPAQPAFPSINSGAAYVGGGTEIGDLVGLRVDAGDMLLFKTGSRRNNLRVTAGVFFRF